jgi:hypothetical protein
MLSDELKSQGIRYVFAIGSSTAEMIRDKAGKKERKPTI